MLPYAYTSYHPQTNHHIILYPYTPPLGEGNTLRVQVLPRPRRSRGGNVTWTVDSPPGERLKKNNIVTLITEHHEVARGRVSIVTDLRRHWVTFQITRTPGDRVYVRAPIIWTHLDGLERYTHMTRYAELSPTPEPHSSYRHLPNFSSNDENPYMTNSREEYDEEMEQRISEIMNEE